MKTSLVIGVLIVLLIGVLIVFRPAMPDGGGLPDDAKTLLEVRSDDHILGPATSTVTLIEYSDFQCPACRAYASLVAQALARVPDARFVYRHFPLTSIHPKALAAGYASEAASAQGKFFEMGTILFEKQDEWAKSISSNELFMGYAARLGLDATKFETDMKSASTIARVERDYASALKLGLNSTPTFFVNGTKVIQNPRSVDEFVALLEAARSSSSTTTP